MGISSLSFQTPVGALVLLAVVLPLFALAVFERRAKRVRKGLGLTEPQRRTYAPRVVAICVLGCLLALAAAQPVLTHSSGRPVLKDAEAYAVFDTSESMLARQPGTPSRIARSRQIAIRVRDALPDVAFGVVSFAEAALPHMFPSYDTQAFAATVDDAVRIGEPPSPNVISGAARGTDLSALAALNSGNYFLRSTTHRLLLVFSDDESSPFYPRLVAAAFRSRTPIRIVFVHVWDSRERISLPNGRVDPRYTPDASSLETVNRLASLTGGKALSEQDVGAVIRQARADVGSGKHGLLPATRVVTPLARWLLLLAFAPLVLILRVQDLYASVRVLGTRPWDQALRRIRSSASRFRTAGLASLMSSRR